MCFVLIRNRREGGSRKQHGGGCELPPGTPSGQRSSGGNAAGLTASKPVHRLHGRSSGKRVQTQHHPVCEPGERSAALRCLLNPDFIMYGAALFTYSYVWYNISFTVTQVIMGMKVQLNISINFVPQKS